PDFLTELEIAQLLNTARMDDSELGKRNCMILYLLYGSGMRISELCQLKMSDVRFDIGIIAIQGKGGRERMVPLPQMTLEMLRDYIQATHARRKSETGSVDYLFPI